MSPRAGAARALSVVPEPVRPLVQAWQGAVWILSEEPGGTVVVDEMPASDKATAGTPSTVLLVVRDAASLRRVAPKVDAALRARRVAVVLRSWARPEAPAVRPEWPPLENLRVTRLAHGSGIVVAQFAQDVSVVGVVGEIARVVGHGLAAPSLRPGDPTDYPHDGDVAGHGVVVSPVDRGVFNPSGFRRTWETEIGEWQPHQRLDGATLRQLRSTGVLRLEWPDQPSADYAADVVALCMAGIPVASSSVPDWATTALGPLVQVLDRDPASLVEPLPREEHSIRVRRTAQHRFAGRRVDGTGDQSVSIVLATRRPEMLAFALRQINRQRHPQLEVVVAAHGFDPSATIAESCGDIPIKHLEVDASLPFGDVLNAGSSRCDGDLVLKMDDDDWYGPDFVGDLVLAKGYSGADLVGMPAEIVFLEPLWVTIRRRWASEVFTDIVAGGTILLSRTALREVGGFRSVPRSVDAGLFQDLRTAGGTIYRTHGLSYMLRRGRSGHTWNSEMQYFLRKKSQDWQWHGFHPTNLMELDEADLPRRAERQQP